MLLLSLNISKSFAINKNDSIFNINYNTVFTGIDNKKINFIFNNEIYIQNNTDFIECEVLFANLIMINKTKRPSTKKGIKIIKNSKIRIHKESKKLNDCCDLVYESPLGFPLSNLFYLQKYKCLFPTLLKYEVVMDKKAFNYNIKHLFNNLNKQNLAYYLFIKSFSLKILLLNKPPPVLLSAVH